MRPLGWSLAPPLLLAGLGLLATHWPPPAPSLLLGLAPALLGLIQWAVLHPQLQRWGWFWIPACYLGVGFAFLGMWWFLLCLGLGWGLAQAPLLAAARLRRTWLWVPASGLGWAGGLLLGGSLDVVAPGPAGDPLRLLLLHSVALLIYSLTTAAALTSMGAWTAPRSTPPND